jgi:outer membrane immunogenic protein
MFRSIVLALAGGLVFTAANAADVYVPGPAAGPGSYKDCCAPLWTGFYIGGNGGYGWDTASHNIAFTQTDIFNAPVSFNVRDSLKLDGAIGGAQVGYNAQISRLVLGVEADIQASGQNGTSRSNGTITSSPTDPATVTDNRKLNWFATVRERIGLTFGNLLVYGTGGVAYGEVAIKGNVQPGSVFQTNAPIVWNHSADKVGWVAGAGVENQITPHWSWKVEYLFMDLGSVQAPVSGGVAGGGGGNCYGHGGACFSYRNPPSGSITSQFADNIVRAGINYHISEDYVPLK